MSLRKIDRRRKPESLRPGRGDVLLYLSIDENQQDSALRWLHRFKRAVAPVEPPVLAVWTNRQTGAASRTAELRLTREFVSAGAIFLPKPRNVSVRRFLAGVKKSIAAAHPQTSA